jgi:hypothetical protein
MIILRSLQQVYGNPSYVSLAVIDNDEVPIAVLLFSATCVGNDGKSCPLFHSSLAPMIMSELHRCYKLAILLLQANTITWTQNLVLDTAETQKHVDKIIELLPKTRYSCRTIRSVELSSNPSPVNASKVIEFLTQHCEALGFMLTSF